MTTNARSKMVCFGFALGFAFLAASASADVVGYFKFDNFPGDNAYFTDDTGKGLRGLLGYPFTTPRSVPGPSGKAGDFALSLDGKGGLTVDDSTAKILNILKPPLTLECWVRATNFQGGHRGLISYGVPGGSSRASRGPGGYKLGIDPNGNILFTLFGVVDVFSGVPYPFDSAWHHIAATYSLEDGGVRYYLDGQEATFIAETRAIAPPGVRQLDLGVQYTGIGRWEGDIDRARVSTAALKPNELDSDASTVKPVRNDTAIFFDFDKGNAPYQGQGFQPAGVAVSTADWVIEHPPHESDGDPGKVNDTPSGASADRSLQFGGSDMAAVWDPNGALNLDGDWTLEAWVRINPNLDGDRDVIFYYGHPGRGYSLSVNYAAGNKLQVTTLGIADMPSDTAVVEVDVWQHLAVAHKKGQSITYFINGKEAGTRAYTGGTRLAETSKVLYIGAEWNGGLPFTGLIDRVRISNSALTVTELDSDPVKPAPVPAPALKLAIGRSQSNVILSWPEANSSGYILEFSDIIPPTNWSPETTTAVVASGQKTVTVPVLGSARFYRLKRP
ncbi:MAG: LamG domain-containing protein [Verrucomicrobia bacterium]|nr:LamG domain-containing protein [Verrucomicrobiota bacterium]